MNEEAVPYERKYEVELTGEEIELLKECLRERNDVLQRDLYQSVTVQNAIENAKKNSYDDDFKEWNNRKLSAQYKEQAMIAHIENVFKDAPEYNATAIYTDYDLCYISKKPVSILGDSRYGTKDHTIPSNVPIPLDGTTIQGDEYAVRFEARPEGRGYAIIIKRR